MIVDHVLRTSRLILEPVTAHDHIALMDHWTAPEVRQFLFDGAIMPAGEVAWMIADSERRFAEHGYGFWVIRELAAPILVGTAGLRRLEDLGIEVVYSLAPTAWGKGYATEAAGAVIEYAVGPLGLPEFLAEIDDENTASVAVIERLGMRPFAVVPGLLGRMTRYRRTP
jgi:RimJ/RimL family protein N-acetyltransferase